MIHDISRQINLNDIINRMQRVLRDAMGLVAIGLHAQEGIKVQMLTLPDVTMQQQYDSTNHWTDEEAKDAWKNWILRNGFRDIAEALSWLLEEAQFVLAYWELAVLQRSKPLRGGDWNEIIVHRKEQFHRRTLPQKFEFLEEKYSFTLDSNLVKQVLSINACRNCLTHRQGIVSQLDIDQSGNLTLEWSALVLLERVDGQEQEINPPYDVKAGAEIYADTRRKKKSFALNERVFVSADEFSQLCFTLYTLAVICVKELETNGKDRGIKFTNNAV